MIKASQTEWTQREILLATVLLLLFSLPLKGQPVEPLVLVGHTDWITDVDYSPDGKLLASTGRDKTVKLWSSHNGELIRTIVTKQTCEQRMPVQRPDSIEDYEQYFARQNPDWTKERVAEFAKSVHADRKSDWESGYIGQVSAIRFSPAGQTLAALLSSTSRQVGLYNAESGQVIHTMDLFLAEDPIEQLRQGGVANADFGFGGAGGGAVGYWPAYPAFSDAIAYSPNGKYLAAGNWNGTVKVFDPEGKELVSKQMHDTAIVGVAYLATNGERPSRTTDAAFLTGDQAGTIRIWSTKGKLIREWQTAKGVPAPQIGHPPELINAISVSADGHYAAVTRIDQRTEVWSIADGRSYRKYPYKSRGAEFSPDGAWLAMPGTPNAGTILIVDFESGDQIGSLSGHEREVTSVAFSPDGMSLASSSADRTVRIWDISQFKERSRSPLPSPRKDD